MLVSLLLLPLGLANREAVAWSILKQTHFLEQSLWGYSIHLHSILVISYSFGWMFRYLESRFHFTAVYLACELLLVGLSASGRWFQFDFGVFCPDFEFGIHPKWICSSIGNHPASFFSQTYSHVKDDMWYAGGIDLVPSFSVPYSLVIQSLEMDNYACKVIYSIYIYMF